MSLAWLKKPARQAFEEFVHAGAELAADHTRAQFEMPDGSVFPARGIVMLLILDLVTIRDARLVLTARGRELANGYRRADCELYEGGLTKCSDECG